MRLDKFIVVFVILIGKTCLSKILINPIKSDGFIELQDAAIKILTTCYADKDKTIVLVGDFPGTFIERLSSHRSFSLALLDSRRRQKDNIVYDIKKNSTHQDSVHKVHIFVMRSSSASPSDFKILFENLMESRYFNAMASVLLIGWSREKKYAACDGKVETGSFMYGSATQNVLNMNILCRHLTKGIILYTSNPFTNKAPEPWKLVKIYHTELYPIFSLFERNYSKNERICENLDIDRTRDLGGYAITVLHFHKEVLKNDENELKTVRQLRRNKRSLTHFKDFPSNANEIADHISIESFRIRPSEVRGLVESAEYLRSPHEWLVDNKCVYFIANFLKYVNATEESVWQWNYVGKTEFFPRSSLSTLPAYLRGMRSLSITDAYGVECKYLLTQFRGNKSQLKKILDVIDSYSWYGLCVTYIVTLIFFKYFMHQRLLIGILNLCRLTCNTGLTTLPPNVASQIYFALLLCVVVTMHGIFSGNLAALLTQDIPLRQVNTIQDLADFNYTVYILDGDKPFLNDSGFQLRIIELQRHDDCLLHVLSSPRIACLRENVDIKTLAEEYHLHISDQSVTCGYYVNIVRWDWPLPERLNTFLRIAVSGGFLLSLDATVVKKIMLEREAEEIPFEPRIMVLHDLAFAFKIFGIGFGIAVFTFIGEIIFYRIRRGVKSTRVVELNRGKRTKIPSFIRNGTKCVKKIR